SRLASHQRGEEITSIYGRGKLAVSDDIVSQLSGGEDGPSRTSLWNDVAGCNRGSHVVCRLSDREAPGRPGRNLCHCGNILQRRLVSHPKNRSRSNTRGNSNSPSGCPPS